jgi:hypothetical protein
VSLDGNEFAEHSRLDVGHGQLGSGVDESHNDLAGAEKAMHPLLLLLLLLLLVVLLLRVVLYSSSS